MNFKREYFCCLAFPRPDTLLQIGAVGLRLALQTGGPCVVVERKVPLDVFDGQVG